MRLIDDHLPHQSKAHKLPPQGEDHICLHNKKVQV